MRYIPIHAFDNYVEANIIRSRLELEDIVCWLKDENTVTIDPILTNAIGGIKLMVPESQVDRALELLRQFRSEKQSMIKCPRCKSSNVELITTPRKSSNWIGAIVGFLTINLALSGDKVYHCFDCGLEYDEIADKNID